jgi:hypothetical protein
MPLRVVKRQESPNFGDEIAAHAMHERGALNARREAICPAGRRFAMQQHNTVVRVRRFGGADELEVIDAPLPRARRGEVRVRILAAGIEYTDITIRKHLYPWVRKSPPFVMGYDFVGLIDQIGEGVTGFELGDRVADMTMVGSDAAYRTRKADLLTRVPAGVDSAEAATIILSWTTAHQLLQRHACSAPSVVQGGSRPALRHARERRDPPVGRGADLFRPSRRGTSTSRSGRPRRKARVVPGLRSIHG